MSSSRMLQKLEEFLPPGSRLAGTSAKESGLEVSIEKLPGEIVHFFHTDREETKKCLKMVGQGMKCSDYLIFYTRNPDIKEVFCFLELKGKAFPHAVDQIICTYNCFCATTRHMLDGTNCQLVWAANVCLRGGAPQADDKGRMRLEKTFGKGNVRIKQVNKKDTKLADALLREIG